MESYRNSNSSELLWLVLLSARIKKIHSKMKVLEWSQHFSHYKSIGIFPDAQGQLTHKSMVGSCRISNPFEIFMVILVICKHMGQYYTIIDFNEVDIRIYLPEKVIIHRGR